MTQSKPIKYGILAGQGDLTKHVLETCAAQHKAYFVIGFQDQTDPHLLTSHPHQMISIGKVSQILQTLRDQKVTHVILVGRIERPKSWMHLMPDLKGMHLLKKIMGQPFGDDGLFRVLVDFIEHEGFKVQAAEDILGDSLACPAGLLTKTTPTEQDWIDIRRGLTALQAIGAADIGQAVIVQQGIVLAVEAVEGTDELIARSKSLKMEEQGGVLVKMMKPQQEERVDRATVGLKTVENLIQSGFHGMALQAHEVTLLNKDACIDLANKKGFFIIGVTTHDDDTIH